MAVPTPLGENKSADLSFVFDAVNSIMPTLRGGELIILESTCPPGTTSLVAEHVDRSRRDLTLSPHATNSIYVAHCPERVIPGKTLHELRSNSRIIGGIN